MPKIIFVNLPVANVAASTAFYEALGYEWNARFSNEQAAAMVWSGAIYVMLLAKPFFATFTEGHRRREDQHDRPPSAIVRQP